MKRAVVAGVLVVVIAAVGVIFNPLALLPEAEREAGSPPRETGRVSVTDLVERFDADGNIVFVGEQTVTDPQPGTIGWIVQPESEVGAGDVLYVRDQQPVVMLAGERPAWRTMAVDDVGFDVAQLETNLLAFGYGSETEFTVDDTYTSATAAIVSRWQADLGVAETGTVALGDVVFGPEIARVGQVSAAVGDTIGGQASLLTLSATDRQAVFSLTAETIGSVPPGTVISARLPDRSTVEATVGDIAPAGSGIWTVTAAFDDPDARLPRGDSVPVTISWDEQVAVEANTVPASALLRLDRGGYAVETVTAAGVTELVMVEIGQQVGGNVEITAGLEPDMTIIAP